jgi:hypothetical protein
VKEMSFRRPKKGMGYDLWLCAQYHTSGGYSHLFAVILTDTGLPSLRASRVRLGGAPITCLIDKKRGTELCFGDNGRVFLEDGLFFPTYFVNTG